MSKSLMATAFALLFAIGAVALLVAFKPELLILIPIRTAKTIQGSADSFVHTLQGHPYLSRYETELAVLECDGFRLSTIQQEKYDDQTNIQKGERLWYVPENGRKREIGSGSAGSYDFPIFALSDEFTWLEPVKNDDPLGFLSPVGDRFYLNMQIPGYPLSDEDKAQKLQEEWALASYFTLEEYTTIRDCIIANVDSFMKGKVVSLYDRETGGTITFPMFLGSITYIPWISNGDGSFSEAHPYSYACPDGLELTIGGDNSVGRPGRVIGYLDERGYFKKSDIAAQQQDPLVEASLKVVSDCRNEYGKNLEEVYAEWRSRNADKF
ncbi:hypothetical protein K2X83_00705 [Patescibacteria group bacterium]|nr:hypothetical protein [Patescibacteria group bacterium]